MSISSQELEIELRVVFAYEAEGSLARVESLLDRQDRAPADAAMLEALFREFHTMKVGAAAAGFSHAARVLHDAESLLDAVRGAGEGGEAAGELAGLRHVVERVRDEVGEAAGVAPPAGEDAVILRALWPLLARACAVAAAGEGKLVALEIGGGAAVLSGAHGTALRGALLHLVRNAVAHGIEAPATRAAAGKPRVGRILVAAAREPGALRLAVSDDGAGLDRVAIAAAAARAGLSGAAEELVLRPGFSTRAEVDALAGRGIGLDAVAVAVRAMGGALRLESRDGQGCTAMISVPA